MTFFQRLRRSFSAAPVPPASMSVPIALPAVSSSQLPGLPKQPITVSSSPAYAPEPLPEWLADADSLRDEGVLFGLSEARPDGKIRRYERFSPDKRLR